MCVCVRFGRRSDWVALLTDAEFIGGSPFAMDVKLAMVESTKRNKPIGAKDGHVLV